MQNRRSEWVVTLAILITNFGCSLPRKPKAPTFEIDTRNNPAFPGRGFLIDVSGAVYPEVLDVASTFGHLEGKISTYLSAGGAMTLGLRGGGKNVWGRFPFY